VLGDATGLVVVGVGDTVVGAVLGSVVDGAEGTAVVVAGVCVVTGAVVAGAVVSGVRAVVAGVVVAGAVVSGEVVVGAVPVLLPMEEVSPESKRHFTHVRTLARVSNTRGTYCWTARLQR
jgi:hypothetical protein